MFLLLPLGIVVVCFAVCAWILWHKIPYLKKLSPEVIEVSHETENATFWSEMYPELTSGVRKFDWPSKKQFLILETEKIVRKLRLFFQKIESFFMRLSLRLKRPVTNEDNREDAEEVNAPAMQAAADPLLELRMQEQRLIIEIAKNPKDAVLYDQLGNIYSKTGEIDDARESFKTAHELDPENEEFKAKFEQLESIPETR